MYLRGMRVVRPILLTAATLVLAWGMIYYYGGVLLPIRQAHVSRSGNSSDLYPVWLGARELLLHHRNPYSPEVTREIQLGFYGREIDPNRNSTTNPEAFAYPAYVALVIAPSVPFSFETVRIVFKGLMLLLSPVSLLLWMRALRVRFRLSGAWVAFTAAMSSFAFVDGLYLEQTTLLVALLVAGSLAALSGGRPVVAGLLLALASVKPQVTILVVTFLLVWAIGAWSSRKGFAIGFGGVMGALLIGSEVMLPGWFRFWRQAAQRYVGYHNPSILAILLGRQSAMVVGAAAVGMCGLLFWRFRKEPPGSEQFSFAVVTGLTLTVMLLPNPGGAYYNQVILIPAALWLFSSGRHFAKKGGLPRFTWLIAVNVLAWEWILALLVSFAAIVLQYKLEREATLFVGGPEILIFVFPGTLALFVLSVAPQLCRTNRPTAS